MLQKPAPRNYYRSQREYMREKEDNPFVNVERDLFALGRRILWSFMLLVTNGRNQRTHCVFRLAVRTMATQMNSRAERFVSVCLFVCNILWIHTHGYSEHERR